MYNKKRPRIANEILGIKRKEGGITILDFKLCYKATVIKQQAIDKINRFVNKCNRKEDEETIPATLKYLTFDKGTKYFHWRKVSLLNKQCCENMPKIQPDPIVSPYIKLKKKKR